MDLTIEVIDQNAQRWNLRPTGAWTREPNVEARTNILVYATGNAPIRMVTAELPRNLRAGRLSANLHSPGIPVTSQFAKTGTPAELDVTR